MAVKAVYFGRLFRQRTPKMRSNTALQSLASLEHERLLAALKASRAGTWRWNIVDDIVEWDDALCEVYGIGREHAPTRSSEFLELIHPEDRATAWRSIS